MDDTPRTEANTETDAETNVEDDFKGQYCLKTVEKMIDLAYDIIPHWPAVFRYTRGEWIINLLHEMEGLCVAGHLKYFKKSTLQELDIKNHQLQLAILGARRKTYQDKSGKRRTLLKPEGYEIWAKLSLEAGRLIGGWIESQKNVKKAEPQ